MSKSAIFVFFLIIFSLKFFDGAFASSGILKNLCFAYMFVAFVLSVPYFFKFSGGFVFPIQLITTAIVLSIFMAKLTWNQGFEYSSTTLPYLMWIAFFFLMGKNIPIHLLEKFVLIYGVVYILLFLFQLTHSDVVYFGFREFVEDRGIIRIIFPGGGVFFLSCFIALNRITSSAKYRYLWISYALLGVVIMVLQVTRQLIFLMLFFYLLHFLKNVKLPYKLAAIAFFAIGTFIFLNSDNPISRGLAEQQKADASAGGDYIRILGAEYFLTQFTPNTISKILGNGFYNDNSSYGKTLNALSANYGYFLSDVGWIEVYISFGIIAVIGYILIFIKSFTTPLPASHHYLKYYLWLVMCTAFTSDILISYGFIITTTIALYCYQKIAVEQSVLSHALEKHIKAHPSYA